MLFGAWLPAKAACVTESLGFGQVGFTPMQLLSALLELLLGSLLARNVDTRAMPFDNFPTIAAHREFVVQHPAVFPVSPSYPRRALKALARGDRLPPLLYKSFDIFRMNKGSPLPPQQPLQRLPYEVEPPLIEEIKVAIRSGGVDQRGRRVDNLAKE